MPDGIYRLRGGGTGRGRWLLADRKSRTRQPSVSSTKGLKQNSDELGPLLGPLFFQQVSQVYIFYRLSE